MPPKRPRAPSSPEPGSVTHSSRRRSSTSYDSLPTELKITIIELACLSSPPHSGPLCDLATCLHISLVNKQFYAQTLPHLYRQISITRPSSLYSLEQTLQSHPERGPLIKNLHIGSQSSLSSDWWPITQAYPETGSIFGRTLVDMRSYAWLATSLPAEQLPTDLEPAWPLDAPKSGCRAAAIDNALQVAQSCLGVDLLREGMRRHEDEARRIEAILEVQAVFDLYVTKIKQIEDADPKVAKLARPGARVPAPCRNGKCEHYPPLVITEVSPPSSSSTSSSRTLRSRPSQIPSGAFVLSRSTLLRHISRRGAVGDRFDHPLLIERSGFEVAVLPPPGRGHEGYREGSGARYQICSAEWHYEGAHEADDWLHLAALGSADENGPKQGHDKALNAPLLNTATFGADLRLARSVIAQATALQNLSLTGFVERAVGSSDQSLPGLRRLTIGPPPLAWSNEITLHGLEHIEELRIGGAVLMPSEIEVINDNCRSLKTLLWSMGHPFHETDVELLLDIFDCLVNEAPPSGPIASQTSSINTAPRRGEAEQPPGREASEEPDEHAPAMRTESDTVPLVIAHLDKSDIACKLASTNSADVKKAWREGLPLPRVPRRLLLLGKDVHFNEAEEMPPSKDNTSKYWEKLYKEGTEWWFKGAV